MEKVRRSSLRASDRGRNQRTEYRVPSTDRACCMLYRAVQMFRLLLLLRRRNKKMNALSLCHVTLSIRSCFMAAAAGYLLYYLPVFAILTSAAAESDVIGCDDVRRSLNFASHFLNLSNSAHTYLLVTTSSAAATVVLLLLLLIANGAQQCSDQKRTVHAWRQAGRGWENSSSSQE